jgi:NADH dehydrogenase
MRGFIAWLAWLFIHIFYLIGFHNRVAVLFDWFWSYVSYKRGARLITSTGWSPTVRSEAPAALVAHQQIVATGVPHLPGSA